MRELAIRFSRRGFVVSGFALISDLFKPKTGGIPQRCRSILAKEFGPGLDGLFLAFPAILVASTTLVEKHECEPKDEKGLDGLYPRKIRGRRRLRRRRHG